MNEPTKLTLELNDTQLAELIAQERKAKGKHFVAVVFLMPDDLHSRQFAETVERLAWRYRGKLSFWRVDVIENPGAATACDVDKAPTTLIFKNGVEVHKYTGQFALEYLSKLIERIIGK